MSIISIQFIIFVTVGLIIYYVVPKKVKWIVLLLLSYVFYLSAGVKFIGYLIFTTVTTFFSGKILGKKNIRLEELKSIKNGKSIENIKFQKKIIVAITLILNFGLLYVLKYLNFTLEILNKTTFFNISLLNILLPLGISFYIFQSIGYIIDIYRNKYKSEKNILKFALFVSYFPQITQGPIGRFDLLQQQIIEPHKFSFKNIQKGIQLILWGYFKKLVIADRAAIVVNTVVGNYENYAGSIIFFSIILYCIQLYCDFSGGIDIIRGVSSMFAIELAQNFKRPIFATSLAEFWRRWHITLGAWLKDYLFYPLTLSKGFIKLGKKIREKLNGRAGKIIPVSIATFVVYFVVGIWHGSSLKYIVFGLWNGAIITTSLLLEPSFIKIKERLKINDKNKIYTIFQIIRTSIIIVIGRYITRATRFLASVQMLKITITNFKPFELVNGIFTLGISKIDYIVIGVGTILMLLVETLEEYKWNIREKINSKPVIVQWLLLMSMLAILFVFGICRSQYISSEFIYKNY